MRRIAVVTGTRAEYGLLYCVIKGIYEDPELELQLIVTGMHLVPEFGLTVREIEKDGFPIARKVKMSLSSDTEKGIATSMGKGLTGFAEAYHHLKPDILLVLGDRFEILSAVAAAIPFRMPVAHIHGGEATFGLIDEAIRHAVTKMSHIHFTATKEYRRRVIQMGEAPRRVFYVGAPGLDNIYNMGLIGKEELFRSLGLPQDNRIGVVTYHPVTLEKDTSSLQISELLKALEKIKNVYWIFTLPNADTGGRIIIKKINDFCSRDPGKASSYASLGHRRYLSLLKHADLMVGNSSSGLIEAPCFKLPAVNIGDRQLGRIRPGNVIDIRDCEERRLICAIKKALSPAFRDSLKSMENPYRRRGASKQIVKRLKTVRLGEDLIKKRFYNITL